ncbi:MAG: twitching motility protein PilT [Gammaproteobacteria bacterium BRH_c0]|nr:MAG: twitching motility protein PilT [Gammaproteobacteria bacterium BRH_c0]
MADLVDFLNVMAKKEASDLYFTAGAPVQIKIQGVTMPIANTEVSNENVKQLIYGVMNDKQKKELESTLESNFAISVPELGRFRVNVFFQRSQMAVVVRYLKSKIPSIEDLGLPVILRDLVLEPRGLILVVGSTGSGKSTTLASMIDHRSSTRTGHILTIEDPVEYLHIHKKSIVNQREVGIDTMNYASALKNALREAPDVIMIGEIRDAETMRHAIAYADTGHLCLSTLHANNAYQGLERIANFFPETSRRQVLDDLALNIKGIFSQRLLTALNGGRVPACELMLSTPYIVDLIQQGEFESIRDTMEHSTDVGMMTFEQSVFDLYMNKKISREEALRGVDSKGNLQTRIRLAEARIGEAGNFSMEDEKFL